MEDVTTLGTVDLFAALSRELRATIDHDGSLLGLSPAWAAVLGADLAVIEETRLEELVDDDDRQAVATLLAELEAGELAAADLRVRRFDGRDPRVLRCRAAPSPGEALGILVAEDVTELLAMAHEHEELRTGAALFEASQRLARLGRIEGDLAKPRLHWCPVVYELFGLDPRHADMDRNRLRELVHPEDRPAVAAVADELLQHGEHQVDFRIVRPDGEVRALRQLTRLAPLPGGSPTRVIGTVQDLTELRATEQALRDSREMLWRVLAATNDGWWELRFDDGGSYYSPRWWALFGYEPGELPATPEPWRQLTHPDDLPAFEAGVDAALAAGERVFELPAAGVHRDGRRVPVIVRGLVEYAEDGSPVRISGATRDVSEAHQAELAKDRFVSTVSHELRTPLTAIGGALELLVHGVVGDLPASAVQLLEVARRNTGRLHQLIDDLLDLERMLEGGRPIQPVLQPLEPLLERSIADNQPYAARYDVQLVLHPAPERFWVRGDADQLAQVLANLLSNAAKYAPAGSEAEVRACRAPDHRGHVRVEVVDHGPGVPEALKDRLFQRFVQADPSDPRSRGGTGLGLAISREIVERHGGRIGLESRPGRSCFWFELPIAKPTA
ncbi:MAG: PAS domain-containing protein [Nitriliruptoraceae bacterium]